MIVRRTATLGALLALSGCLAACGGSAPPPNLPRPASPGSPTSTPPSAAASIASTDSAGAAASAAGTAFALAFFDTDYRRIDDYARQVQAGTTGALRADFDAKLPEVRRLTAVNRSVASGRLLASGIRDVTPTTATQVVALDQTVTTAATNGKPTVQRYRLTERMRLVDQRWLVEQIVPIVDSTEAGCEDSAADADVQELLQQTCGAVARMYSYDYAEIDAATAEQEELTVDPLRAQIEQLAPQLRQRVRDEKARVTAQTCTAAVERRAGDTATVLVFFNETVTSTKYAQPQLDRNRVEATVRRVDGRWRIADIKAL